MTCTDLTNNKEDYLWWIYMHGSGESQLVPCYNPVEAGWDGCCTQAQSISLIRDR